MLTITNKRTGKTETFNVPTCDVNCYCDELQIKGCNWSREVVEFIGNDPVEIDCGNQWCGKVKFENAKIIKTNDPTLFGGCVIMKL